ncbi:citrate synthase [Devosia sp. XJ19-1]|uniref:citrate synthase (unknown stereospecificity) n=1 Tax=Devosia ureilytica TaxID=2952754 RepID=A0A9Q4ARP8_9HYPH|nr:citrate synthase [Devosia ureilytica]MCP8884923.1 citrate synthase [Devosia ureilytica]MCP8888566.1 citrate synthase [Devosia ureilytica]
MNWLTAEEALVRLGTKPQTLYANVSRGRITARPDPGDPRKSLYRQDDVERMASRQQGRRPARTVAAETIAWGEPVLETSIATVADGRLLYRGQDASSLAETATLGAIARLLWNAGAEVDFAGRARALAPGMAAAYRAVAELAVTDMPSAGRNRTVLLTDAARAVSFLTGALAAPGTDPVHERLARQWGHPEAADAIRRALVLLAEHELNASTFAARVTASTGAPLSAAVLAGLAALSGPLHGTASQSMAGLVDRARAQGAEAAIREQLRQGNALPCFGHRLYPEGDVRAKALLAAFEVPELFGNMVEAGERLSGEKPNVDFALCALTEAFALPAEAPLHIFALARSVGWIAHALEQIETGALIRPRARYTGPEARIS